MQELRNTQILEHLNHNDEDSYENVYICKKKGDPKKYVCKVVKEATFNPYEFVVPILMENNPHFVKMHNFVYNKRGGMFFLMDYVADGDLFDLVKKDGNHFRLDEPLCRRIIFNLVNALHDLHQKRLIHNDVKLENLLFDRKKKKRLYVCDYGLVRVIGTPSVYDGTTVYFSPEKITKQPYNPSFDWWAVGVVAYEILSATYPFDIDEDSEEAMNDIEPQDMLLLYSKPLKLIENVSETAMDFVTKMVAFDISNRLSTFDEIIKHPFLAM